MTTDLYSVLPGIQPSAQEILEAELLSTQILSAKYPDMDLRAGTGLRDLVVRPSAVLFAMVKKSIDYIFAQNTIDTADDNTPKDVVDNLLSNWFLDRQLGTLSIISARLYFARQKNVTLSSSVYFSTDNSSKFYPLTTTSYSSSAMAFDSYNNEYYLDVDLIAEAEGSTYNLSAGSLLYFSNFDPFFLRAEINFLKTSSIPSETNSAFIERARTAISTRNLINRPSIDSNLRAAFNYITKLTSVGMGDPEMIRDQITAVFQAAEPRLLTALTSIDTIATATLENHGYGSGQVVTIEDADPIMYNGEYSVTVVDEDTFTYELDEASTIVTSYPTVLPINDPILIHNGGMVDIYCTDTLASATIQVTLDTQGKALLTGPIYKAVRSTFQGGTEEDTLSTNNIYTVSSFNLTGGTTVVATTSLQHHFRVGSTVTFSGATQLIAVTGITCSGVIVTVTQEDHGYLVGNDVVITGAVVTGYNGTWPIASVTTDTFTYVVPAHLGSTSQSGVYSEVNMINGPHEITAIAGSTFTFVIDQVTTPVYGTVLASSPVDYDITNQYIQSKNIVDITCDGTEVTVTLTNHGYIDNRYVTIDSDVDGYNGAWLITSIVNPNQFTFNVSENVSDEFTSGTATFIIPHQDYGFSQNQIMVLDFESYNANKTVSMDINYFQNIDSIQNYLNSSATRVISADYLARGFNFYSLDMEINSYNSLAPDAALVQVIINSYLSTLKAGDMFIMSDMVAQLRLNGIINIQNPPVVNYTKYTRDLTTPETGIITNVLDPNDITNVFILNSVTTDTVVIPVGSVVIN